jgi:HEAT repeat protein
MSADTLYSEDKCFPFSTARRAPRRLGVHSNLERNPVQTIERLRTMPQSSSTSPQQVAVSGICGSLHRAYRDLRLYPPGHPTATESVERLAAAVAGYFVEWPTFTLEVRENALLLDGDEVYLRETSQDNVAFVMFRDGVRSLSLHPGCEVEEIQALADCLAHADDLAAIEHDLVTALWERDLPHISYQVADPFRGGVPLREGIVDALREAVLRRLEVVQAPGVSSGEPAYVGMRQVQPRRLESGSLQLTPQEIESGEQAIEGLSLVLRDYAEVLLEIAGSVFITAAKYVLFQSLDAVVAAFIDEGDVNIEGASFVLGRVGELEAQYWCPAGSVGVVSSGALTADKIRRLLQEAGNAPTDRASETKRFLQSVNRWIVPALLEILTETDNRALRKTVLEILGGEGALPWWELEPLLDDPRWYVVRNAVQLAAGAGHAELTYHAERLLRHPDTRVRRELVRALERFSDSTALNGLILALSDPDSSVRTLAAGAVGRKGGSEQEGLLLARIEDRNFPLLSEEEMEAFFGAYAELAGEKAVPLLDRSWRRKVMSSRPAGFRVAAVLALSRVRGPAAHAALQAAAKSGDPPIERAAAQAAQKRLTIAPGGRS